MIWLKKLKSLKNYFILPQHSTDNSTHRENNGNLQKNIKRNLSNLTYVFRQPSLQRHQVVVQRIKILTKDGFKKTFKKV